MSSIRFNRVVKRYPDGTVAVDDLNVTIDDGEFMIFVGPSGCGKTTALRMVAGLEDVTSGEIFLGDRAINDVDAADRDIAMVFQNYALYPHMSVESNLSFPLRARRLPRHEIAARVSEVGALLGIQDLAKKKPRELSGGQRQRVAMGRAIVRHPKAFLMDEPLSNLDAKLRVQMRAELTKLHRTLGVTTIYVTHDQTEAMTLGQRVTVMNLGVVQQVDAPQQLYDWPANTFVASFIGSPAMNFVRGGLDSETVTLSGGVVAQLPSGVETRVESSRRDVVVGLRPESFSIDDTTVPRATIRGQVETVERLGSEALVYFRPDQLDVLEIGDRPIELRDTLCARLPKAISHRPGDAIELAIDNELLRVFDDATGESVLAPEPGRESRHDATSGATITR